MSVKRQLPASELKENYDRLKEALLSPSNYPKTNKLLNLPAFVKDNEALYIKLMGQLRQLRSPGGSFIDKNSKTRTAPFNVPLAGRSKSQTDRLTELKQRNQTLRQNIETLRDQNSRRGVQQTPLLNEKQRQLKSKSQQIQRLGDLGKQLRSALSNGQMLQLYELMCRQCEHLRKGNNELSEQIKSVILEVNQVTGSEENPNMFLMNLKL